MVLAVSQAKIEVDECGSRPACQQEGVLGQPGVQRKRPKQAVRIQNATLRAVQLLPDGVEQGDVRCRWLIEIEAQMRRQQLVFEHSI